MAARGPLLLVVSALLAHITPRVILVHAFPIVIGPNCSNASLGSCNRALQQALSSRCPRTGCTVVLQPGRYTWDMGTPVQATGLASLTLQGHGATLTLSGDNIAGPALLSFNTCSNLTLLGFTVDALRPLYTVGNVVAVNTTTSSFVMLIDPKSYPLAPHSKVTTSTCVPPLHSWMRTTQAILGWDPEQNRPAGGRGKKEVDIYQLDAPKDSFCLVDASHAIVQVLGSRMSGHAGIHEVSVGQTLLIRHVVYTSTAVLVQNCSRVTGPLTDYVRECAMFRFILVHPTPSRHRCQLARVAVDDVTLLAAPGMGFRAERSRSLRLSRYQVTRTSGMVLIVLSLVACFLLSVVCCLLFVVCC